MTLVFTLSRAHSPGIPAFSDYLFSGGRPIALALLLLALLLSVLYALLPRLKLFVSSEKDALIPLLLLCAGFVANGALSALWSPKSLAFGIAEAFCYLFLAALFYVGLKGESFDDAAGYFAYLSALTVLLLSIELVWLYIGPDTPIVGGVAEKSAVVFGWGIWTSAGAAIAVLIPASLLGATRSRRPAGYFILASLAVAAICATLSRGALIFGLFAYILSLIICARHPATRRTSAVMLFILFSGAVTLALRYSSALPELVGALLADNGRFRLWRMGMEDFLSSPLFGVGFFGRSYPEGEGYFTGADFLPPMMHSTPVELLSSMGIFGAVGYAVYRVSTVRPILHSAKPERLLVLLSAAVMPLLSLVENYVFQFWPIIHYTLALGILRLPEGLENENK